MDKFIGVSILAFTAMIMVFTLMDMGIVGAAAISIAFIMASFCVLLFCGIPAGLRAFYESVWNAQELKLRTFEIQRAREASKVLAFRGGNHLVIRDPSGIPWQVYGPGGGQAELPGGAGMTGEILGPLLPAISWCERLLVIGGPGAGKTSLLLHLTEEKAREGHVIVADSHAAPDSWPPHVQVAGLGRDYPEIKATIKYVCDELDRRYKLRSAGRQKHFEKLFLVIDEGFVLNQFVNIQEELKSILAEGRKVGIGIIFAGHSDRAGALGLLGNKDISSGYEKVIYLSKKTGQHLATVKDGIGDKEGEVYHHPGPWRRAGGSGSGSDTDTVHRHPTPQNMPENGFFGGGVGGVGGVGVSDVYHLGYDPKAEEYVYEPEPARKIYEASDSRAAAVIRMAKAGASISEISKQVFGGKGGRQSRIIKQILSEMGLS